LPVSSKAIPLRTASETASRESDSRTNLARESLARGLGLGSADGDNTGKTLQVWGDPARRQKGMVSDSMSFSDIVTYYRARFDVEDGQTMAEYGVVLAVITALVVVALMALSGAISNALNTVKGYL
jgi:Flp pilus assembly pilin Flp